MIINIFEKLQNEINHLITDNETDLGINGEDKQLGAYFISGQEWNNMNELIKTNDSKEAARIFAEKKWKTEAKRNAYVEQEMTKYVPRTFKFYGITYFDFHVEPWSNCLSNTFSIDKVTTDILGKCYDEIKENKYFKNAIGWILEDHHYSRPQIKLILPEEYEKMWKTDMENLGKAIGEFYKNTKYFGD